ncbi:MAG: hypothetical protein C3F07_13950 [Anaerolineales bacterium]|nr:MAG: hypothetical protein C3F07_13950 [Anaerolineales bacterium]
MCRAWQRSARSNRNSEHPGRGSLLSIKPSWHGSPPCSCIRSGCCWDLDEPMLTQLVKLFEEKENGLSLSEISREMKAQPSAVLSMIELLVQKGKLLEIGPDGKCCTTCGVQSECNLLAARGKRYMVVP